MKCKECKYCEEFGRANMQSGCYAYPRKYYYCRHPKVNEIEDKNGYKITGFIGYGDTSFESPLQLKTSKKWCPLKESE